MSKNERYVREREITTHRFFLFLSVLSAHEVMHALVAVVKQLRKQGQHATIEVFPCVFLLRLHTFDLFDPEPSFLLVPAAEMKVLAFDLLFHHHCVCPSVVRFTTQSAMHLVSCIIIFKPQ